MIQTNEEAEKAFKALTENLAALEKPKELNIFDAVGMATQEIKHSAFLAWLLDPKQTHKKGGLFLSDFLHALYNYPLCGDGDTLSNETIISRSFTRDELIDLTNATDITVATEKVIDDPDSRIDIFIYSKQASIVLVIENKVFTSTHDDQLNKYEREVDKLSSADKSLKKLFVYLTPKGDKPTDINGNYQARNGQNNWCILDYDTILSILKRNSAKIRDEKLNYLIKDYINMVDNKILHNNPTVRALCKQIRREHADAIDILLHYIDNVDMVYNHTAEWLKENLPDVIIEHNGRSLVFYTPAIRDYYERHGLKLELGNGLYRFQASVGSKDGPVAIGMWLSKGATEKWVPADEALRDILKPEKRMGKKYCSLYSVTLLSSEDRDRVFKEDGELYSLIDERLELFKKQLLKLEHALEIL